MIRPYRMTDAICALAQGSPSGRDLAHTRRALGADGRRLSRVEAACYGISGVPGRKMLGAFGRDGLEALIVVQTRRASSAWEIAGFFASSGGFAEMDDLLLAAAAAAGEGGAERVFLRCEAEGPASGPAQRAGFQHAFSEDLFTGRLRATRGESLQFRPVRNSDTHDVFRLQVATAPVTARAAIGLTLNEWLASRESAAGRSREFVCETDRGVSAWARIDRTNDAVIVEALLHPDLPSLAPMLVEGVARAARRHYQAHWLVPDHQSHIAQALTDRGWRQEGVYQVSVKPVARHVRQPQMAPAQA